MEYPDTPRGHLRRLKHKQAVARSEGIEVDAVPDPEPAVVEETTDSLTTKKKSKKKKTG